MPPGDKRISHLVICYVSQGETMDVATLTTSKRQVNTGHIIPTPFNPPSRTSDRVVKGLVESMRVQGQLVPLILVKGDGDDRYLVADGNRRLTAANVLGIRKLDAVIYDPGKNDPDDVLRHLFVDLNKDTVRWSDGEMVRAALLGGPVFTSVVKSTVAYLQKLFPGEIPAIVRESACSYSLSVAKRVVRYCHPSAEGKSFDQRVRVTLLWLVRHKQQQKAIPYIRLGMSPRLLWHAIETDRLTPRFN